MGLEFKIDRWLVREFLKMLFSASPKYLGGAVDPVRKQEHKALRGVGCDALKGTKYDW